MVWWLEEKRNVLWVLIISVIIFFASIAIGPMFYTPLYPPREPTMEEIIWFYVNHGNVLLFIATITSATLFMAGFWRKEPMYKLSILNINLNVWLPSLF